MKPGAMKDIKVLGSNNAANATGAESGEKNVKGDKQQRSDNERTQIRKREHKALMKSLTMAQMSTASMGRFDRKAGKNEPDAPTSQKV